MAHLSPAVNLVWALLSTTLGCFLIFHLWSFDRFNCLKWNHGPHSSAFKRVMTYSYLLSIPLVIIYSVGFAIIKYTYGFTNLPLFGILPTPYEMWSKSAQNTIIPLYVSVSIAWGLEMVTHLEELCFWLFLVHSNSLQQDWFGSSYFKIWAVGSCIAVLVMPLITIFTREDVYKCEAYTFLAGGLGSLSITIWFLPVLCAFPAFLANLKEHNIERNTLLRLTKFHELNNIRVVFRFLFTVPLVILGIDGVRPHQHINDKMFATDFLAIIAGIGAVVSSGITLVIFFPRSLGGEMALKEQRRWRRRQRAQTLEWGSNTRQQMARGSHAHSYINITHARSDLDLNRSASCKKTPCEYGLPTYDVVMTRGQDRFPSTKVTLEEMGCFVGSSSLQPNRRKENGDVELGGVLSTREVELIRARSRRDRCVNELVYHWRSPLDIGPPPVSPWQRQI